MRPELSIHLRSETRPAHELVEKAELLRGIFSSGFDVEAYRKLLCKWYSFFLCFDRQLQGVTFNGFWYQSRLPAIEKDLTNLGVGPHLWDSAPYEGWVPLSFSAKIGSVYVIEGSSLGAKILTKKISQKLGLGDNACLNFYQMQPYKWSDFKDRLDNVGFSFDGEYTTIIDAAVRTFHAIFEHMNGSANGQLMEADAPSDYEKLQVV